MNTFDALLIRVRNITDRAQIVNLANALLEKQHTEAYAALQQRLKGKLGLSPFLDTVLPAMDSMALLEYYIEMGILNKEIDETDEKEAKQAYGLQFLGFPNSLITGLPPRKTYRKIVLESF